MTRKSKRGSGSFEVRGRTTRVILYAGGQRHSFTFETTDRREAQRMAREKRTELLRGLPASGRAPAGRERMSDLVRLARERLLPNVNAARTEAAYKDSLKALEQFFVTEHGDPRVVDLGRKDVREFLDWRRTHRLGEGSRPVAGRTVAKDRAVLHRLFRLAIEHEWRDSNPVGAVPAPKSDTKQYVILNGEQFEALLTACADSRQPMLATYVLLLAETGVRCDSEALYLRWEDINFETRRIRIVSGRNDHRTKTGRTREVPMTPRLLAAMRGHVLRYKGALYDGVPSPWVFHHPVTSAHFRAGARIHSLFDAFKRAAERAKLPPSLRQHDLRHRRATEWLRQGQPIALVQKAMGHSAIQTTMLYTHLTSDDLDVLVEQKPAAGAPRAEQSA